MKPKRDGKHFFSLIDIYEQDAILNISAFHKKLPSGKDCTSIQVMLTKNIWPILTALRQSRFLEIGIYK